MKKSIGTLIVLMGLPAAGFQAADPDPRAVTVYQVRAGYSPASKGRYLPRPSPAVDYANSMRLDKLMRAGRIYLSLQDAIALALENNLDIEFARYEPARRRYRRAARQRRPVAAQPGRHQHPLGPAFGYRRAGGRVAA